MTLICSDLQLICTLSCGLQLRPRNVQLERFAGRKSVDITCFGVLGSAVGVFWVLLCAFGCFGDAFGCFGLPLGALDASECFGCFGMLWMHWDALGCVGMFLDTLECFGVLWCALGCVGVLWVLLSGLGCFEVLWDAFQTASVAEQIHKQSYDKFVKRVSNLQQTIIQLSKKMRFPSPQPC